MRHPIALVWYSDSVEGLMDIELENVTFDQARAWVAQRDATLREFEERGIEPKNTPTWQIVNALADGFAEELQILHEEEE